MEDFKNKIIPLNKNEQNKLTGGFVVVSNQNVQFGASDDTNLNCHGSKLQHSTTTNQCCPKRFIGTMNMRLLSITTPSKFF